MAHRLLQSRWYSLLRHADQANSANPGTGHKLTETVAAIVAAHRAGTATPAQTVARSYQRIRDHNDPAVFISLRDEKDALAEAERLTTKDAAQLPLLGVPVAVKDNIDAQGMPTTAACPASFRPTVPPSIRCAPILFLADRVRDRQSRFPPAACRSRSAPIRRVPA